MTRNTGLNPAPTSHRRGMPVFILLVLASLFILAVDNATFFSRAQLVFAGNPVGLVTYGGVGFATILFSLAVLSVPGLEKPVVALLLILSSATAYFQDTLGATIDRTWFKTPLIPNGCRPDTF